MGAVGGGGGAFAVGRVTIAVGCLDMWRGRGVSVSGFSRGVGLARGSKCTHLQKRDREKEGQEEREGEEGTGGQREGEGEGEERE